MEVTRITSSISTNGPCEVSLTNPDTYEWLASQVEASSSLMRDPALILEEIEEELGCSLIFLTLR